MVKRPSTFLERLVVLVALLGVVELIVLTVRALRPAGPPKAVEDLSRDLETSWKRLAELEDALGTARKEREELDAKLRCSKDERDLLLAQLQAARKEIAAATDRIREIEARAVKSESERDSLRRERDLLAASEAKLGEALKSFQSERDLQLGEVRSLRADLESWWDESAKLRDAAQEAVRAASEATLLSLTDIRGRLDETSAGVKGGASKLDAALARAETLATEVAALRKSLDGWESRLARATAPPAPVRPSATGVAPGGGPGADPATAVPSTFKGFVEVPFEGSAKTGDPAPAREAKDGGTFDDPVRIEAKVKVVQDGVLVIDKGSRAGVREGREFEIRRGERKIARARVERVKTDLCGATILSGEPGEVKAGDLAVFEGR